MCPWRTARDGTFAQSPKNGYTVSGNVSDRVKRVDEDVVETDLPEILDDGILLVVTTIIGVLDPIININLADTTNEQLELSLIEDIDEIGRDELVEALNKSLELLVDTLLNAPFCYESVEK